MDRIEKAKEVLLDYFNRESRKTHPYLENLDENEGFYSGVTLSYLQYYIVPELELWEIGEILYDLLEQDEINALYCNDVKNFVFNSKYFTSYASISKSKRREYDKCFHDLTIKDITVYSNDILAFEALIDELKEKSEKGELEEWNYI